MRLLLDTHIWLWSLLEPERLGRRVAPALDDPDNEIWLSPISTWEALMLIHRGRLEVTGDPVSWIDEALKAAPLREAPLTHPVAIESRRLRFKDRDPADRFLLATARVYELTLVTADRRLVRSKDCAVLAND